MDITERTVLLLGGSGLVGTAICRGMLPHRPSRVVIAALTQAEAESAIRELGPEAEEFGTELVAEWGDIFLRGSRKGAFRSQLLTEAESRSEILADLFAEDTAASQTEALAYQLLHKHSPSLVVDCINTATVIAYQDIFRSARRVQAALERGGSPDPALVEAHLSTLYLPQLIRHVQAMMRGMREAKTQVYLKVGTSGTGGMGLNVPFTHSEERPSATLLAKASVAGAHSMLLFLMGRTPDAPIVKEVKPTAAVAWKRIAFGTVTRGGQPIPREDSTTEQSLSEAFGPDAGSNSVPTGESLESVYLDAGENGLFSLSEFETIASLGLMEFITPEEIADAVLSEILGRPTGHDIVGALDASTLGPTYRAGALRESALRYMEMLESAHDIRSVAFEMLGPPRLSKLLFEAHILERFFGKVSVAAGLDPDATASRAATLVREDSRLRSDILSVGIPILMPDGEHLLRGSTVSVEPDPDDGVPHVDLAHRGWVDLRPASWEQWRERCQRFHSQVVQMPGADAGSGGDLDERSRSGDIRSGALAAFVLRYEEAGERMKR
jgi:NAD(P)-dependent dehydrogenase (short-subunit alcohol dehydrogenase family)